MVLIPSELKTEWRNAVDDLNVDLGHACQLVFESGQSEVSNVSASTDGLKPNVVMPFGGRTHGFTTPGHDTLSPNVTTPGQHIQIDEATKNIQCRVYHVTKDLARMNIHVSENINVYEVLCHIKFVPDILRAKHIVLYLNTFKEKLIKAKLTVAPAPYGLGDLYQCRSFWEEF